VRHDRQQRLSNGALKLAKEHIPWCADRKLSPCPLRPIASHRECGERVRLSPVADIGADIALRGEGPIMDNDSVDYDTGRRNWKNFEAKFVLEFSPPGTM